MEEETNMSGLSREDVYKILEEMSIPYVKAEVYKDQRRREDSPIGTLCDTFECLVNSLLGDAAIMGSEEAGTLLNHFYNLMKEQIILSQLILKNRKEEDMPEALKEMLEGREGIVSYEGKKTPIDSVWLDAFKDEGKEEEEKEEEEGKRKEEEDNT